MTFLNWLGALPGAAALGIIWGIMAIGVYVTYKILDIADLTVDGSICTGAAVCAVLVTAGANIWVAMLVAMLAGIFCGLITGFFHTLMGIPAILAGILTQLILWSVNLKIMGKSNIGLLPQTYSPIVTNMREDRVQTLLILAAIIAVVIAALYWFFGTEIGASLRATGCNLSMSRAQGINTDLNKIIGLALSNGIVAFSGALLAQFNGNSDINMGRGAIVVGLAAVIIGEALTSKFAKNFAVRLLGVVLGGIVYYFVYQTVVFFGLDTDLLKMLSAIVVAVFLATPYWKKKYFSASRKKATVSADANTTVKEDEKNA